MQHLEEGTIHAWLDGALSDAEAADVARHVDECAACSAMVAEARGLIAGASRIVGALDITRGGVIPGSPAAAPAPATGRSSAWRTVRFTPMRAAIAATVILAVGSVYTVRRAPDEARVVSPTPAASPATAPTADTAAKAPVATPAVAESRTRNERVAPPAAANQAQAPAREAAGPQPTARRDAPKLADQSDLSKTVAGGVASRPAAPPPPQAAILDSLAARPMTSRAPAAAGAGAAFAEQRRADSVTGRRKVGSNALQLSEVVATSAAARAAQDRPTGVVRCYVIRSAPDWATGVPMRFALDDAPAFDTSLTRRVVRRVTDEGKVDGPIAGSWWQRSTTDGGLQVTLMRAAPANDLTLTMALRAQPPGRATISDRSRSQDVEVATTICSP